MPLLILEKIDETRLLIGLTGEDMDLLDLTFSQLNWKDDYSREVIWKLLSRAKKEIGFMTDDRQLMIEAIPQQDGCVVLITLLAKLNRERKIFKIKENKKPYVFSFKSSEDLIRAIERLYDNECKFIRSTVLEYNEKYYIILYIQGSVSTKLQAVVSEYGELIGKDFIVAAQISEQGRIIAKNNAIEKIGRSFR